MGRPGHDMNPMNEHMLDTFLENIQGVAADDFTVQLKQQPRY